MGGGQNHPEGHPQLSTVLGELRHTYIYLKWGCRDGGGAESAYHRTGVQCVAINLCVNKDHHEKLR